MFGGHAAGGAVPPLLTLNGRFGLLQNDFGFLEGYGNSRGVTPLASYQYLYSKGIRRIRLCYLWPSMQPTIGAALNSAESTRLLSEIANIHAAGLKCSVANMNSGGGTDDNNGSDLVDHWTRMSTLLNGNPGVFAYDLVNEPHNITSSNSSTTTAGNQADAAIWKVTSQNVVNAIRANGDTTRCHVQGVNYANAQYWSTYQGSTPWISDSANNIAYSVHVYIGYGDYFTWPKGGAVTNSATGCTGDYIFQDNANYYSPPSGAGFAAWQAGVLSPFVTWCQSNGVRGDVGETGWPSYLALNTYQGLAAATATTNVNAWNTFAATFLEQIAAAGFTCTYNGISGSYTSSGGASGNGAGCYMADNSSGSGIVYTGGLYTPSVLNNMESQYAAFQTAGIWP